MTLRDLTLKQLYNLRRRSEKERKTWAINQSDKMITIHEAHVITWNAAFNAGLKAGLELHK